MDWPAQINGVDYDVDWDGTEEGGDDEGGDSLTMNFIVDHIKRHQFIRGLRGYVANSYVATMHCPEAPELRFRAWKVLECIGGGYQRVSGSLLSQWDKCRIAVTFAPPKNGEEDKLDPGNPETVFEESWDSTARVLKLKEGMLEFDDGDEFDGELGKIEVDGTLTLTFPRVMQAYGRNYLRPILFYKQGLLNDRLFLDTFPPGTVSFAAFSMRKTWNEYQYMGYQTSGGAGRAVAPPPAELVVNFQVASRDWNTYVKDDGTEMLVRYKDQDPITGPPPRWWPALDWWPWPPPAPIRRPYRYGNFERLFAPEL